MEHKLSAYQFVRIHRSYIINTSKIRAFTSSYIDVNKNEISIEQALNKLLFSF